ncbi:MAG: hypothetical protein WB014_10490 [Methanosarcina sp.]
MLREAEPERMSRVEREKQGRLETAEEIITGQEKAGLGKRKNRKTGKERDRQRETGAARKRKDDSGEAGTKI